MELISIKTLHDNRSFNSRILMNQHPKMDAQLCFNMYQDCPLAISRIFDKHKKHGSFKKGIDCEKFA